MKKSTILRSLKLGAMFLVVAGLFFIGVERSEAYFQASDYSVQSSFSSTDKYYATTTDSLNVTSVSMYLSSDHDIYWDSADVHLRVNYSGTYCESVNEPDIETAHIKPSGTPHLVDFEFSSCIIPASTAFYINHPTSYNPNFYSWGSSGSFVPYVLINGSPDGDVFTHFITLTPLASSSVASSTATIIGFSAYVASSSVGQTIEVRLNPVNTLFGEGSIFGYLGGDFTDWPSWSFVATTTGVLNWSTTTNTSLYSVGSYVTDYQFKSLCLPSWLSGYCFGSPTDPVGALMATSSSWFIGSKSVMGDEFEKLENLMSGIYSGAGTSTSISVFCNILSISDFEATKCLGGLFIPTSSYLKDRFLYLYNNVGSIFPLGYLKSFVDILATSTTRYISLTAEMPPTLPGVGSSLTLDLSADKLDWIYNATSSQFKNSSASSTSSFYDLTYYYWKILIYIALGFYIISRILGTHIIGNIGDHFGGGVADKSFKGRRRYNKINDQDL